MRDTSATNFKILNRGIKIIVKEDHTNGISICTAAAVTLSTTMTANVQVPGQSRTMVINNKDATKI